MTTPDTTPNPGSQAALDLGCQCPVMDNGHGSGVGTLNGKTLFVFNGECPVHDAIMAVLEALVAD